MWLLIVDDDDDIRDVMATVLELHGFAARTAREGAEGLALMREAAELPCLILLDLMMPGMNGWDFRHEQRRDERLAGVPVVAMSGDYRVDEKAVGLDCVAALRKPIELAELVRLASDFCGPRKGSRP